MLDAEPHDAAVLHSTLNIQDPRFRLSRSPANMQILPAGLVHPSQLFLFLLLHGPQQGILIRIALLLLVTWLRHRFRLRLLAGLRLFPANASLLLLHRLLLAKSDLAVP